MSVIAFRTDGDLEQKLERTAARQKKTKTDVIREALELYLENAGGTNPRIAEGQRVSDALRAEIGVWNGPTSSSVNTGKQLGEILLEKHRTRRV